MKRTSHLVRDQAPHGVPHEPVRSMRLNCPNQQNVMLGHRFDAPNRGLLAIKALSLNSIARGRSVKASDEWLEAHHRSASGVNKENGGTFTPRQAHQTPVCG